MREGNDFIVRYCIYLDGVIGLGVNEQLISFLEEFFSFHGKVVIFIVKEVKKDEWEYIGKYPGCPQSIALILQIRHGITVDTKYIVIAFSSKIYWQKDD